MEDEVYLPCVPPGSAEVGDVWYCPDCARRFDYVLFLQDDEIEIEAWFTERI